MLRPQATTLICSLTTSLSVFDKDDGKLKRIGSYGDEDYNATIAFASLVQNNRVYVAGGLAPDMNVTDSDVSLMLAHWPQKLEGCARTRGYAIKRIEVTTTWIST